ncbi:MAG: hypothetical protein ABIT01_13885 [Thermoanaerobaculia bacterium]
MKSSAFSVRLLTDLEGTRRLRPGAARAEALLLQAERFETKKPEELVRFHDALLFLASHPHSRSVRARAEKLLGSFVKRIEALVEAGADVSFFDRPEAAGVAGIAVAMTFSYDIACWLERCFPNRIRIDWDVFGEVERLGPFLSRVLPLVREEALADANVLYREALEDAAKRRKQRPLTFILRAIEALGLPPADAAALYDALSIQIWWELGRDAVSRTRLRRAPASMHFQDEPLGSRRDVSLAAELSAPALPFERLSRVEGAKALDLSRSVLAVRYRELHAFTHGDPGSVVLAQAGRGVELLINGVAPAWRHPLRAGFGFIVLKNGIPVGYGDAYGLFERLEVSFNVFPAFRDGESAFLYGRLLRFFRHFLGTTVFWVDPYQIGEHNEEAVASGAFWFYRKLGFRSVDPVLAPLVRREERRLSRGTAAGFTKAPLLRRFAESPVVYESDPERAGEWDRFHVRNLRSRAVAAMARSGLSHDAYQAAAVRRLAEHLGLAPKDTADPSFVRALGGFALALDGWADLPRFSAAEREVMAGIVAAKAAGGEERYLRRQQSHPRLRSAFLTLGETPA